MAWPHSKLLKSIFLSVILWPIAGYGVEWGFKGGADLAWLSSSNDAPWQQNWLEKGTGNQRWDGSDQGVNLTQGFIELQADFESDWQASFSGFYYLDGDQKLGVTELFATYKPLTQGAQHQVRLGAFYPGMSFENPLPGWLSPYTYNFSAINSWIGEELKTLGAEWQVSWPSRQRRNYHHWSLVSSVFTANDGAGTLLAWRGWAQHDRQSRLNERLPFAQYPVLERFPKGQPSWVEPFEETDGRLGGYIGGHYRYKRQSQLKLYYYNNRADSQQVETSGQYAWHTRFVSLAWLHQFTPQLRWLGQWMVGNTKMGGRASDTDFDSWYQMLTYRWKQHRVTLRYDDFGTEDHSVPQAELNNSKGHSWTLSWRYKLAQTLQLGAEYLYTKSDHVNRNSAELSSDPELVGWNNSEQLDQNLFQLVISARF